MGSRYSIGIVRTADVQYCASMINQCPATDDPRCDFAGHFERSHLPAVKALEREVLGCDYGGTSWTTRAQVDHIAHSLGLGPGVKLLEIGCGSGWPGLLLASMMGCDVTLLDMPVNALKQAAERADEDRITEKIRIIAGSGSALPFVDASFTRLSHSDVLCCLPDKTEMLQECRRVATPHARMHFSVILPAAGLSQSEYRQVLEVGPPFVDAPDGYDALLRDSGWTVLEHLDVSDEYRATLKTLVNGMKKNTSELLEAFGANEFESQCRRRAEQVELIGRGILLREVFVTAAAA